MIRSAAAVATGLAKRLLTCHRVPAWAATAADDRWMGMPQADHRQPAEEVEVPLPVRVPQLRPCTSGEHHPRRTEHRHERARLAPVGVERVDTHD